MTNKARTLKPRPTNTLRQQPSKTILDQVANLLTFQKRVLNDVTESAEEGIVQHVTCQSGLTRDRGIYGKTAWQNEA